MIKLVALCALVVASFTPRPLHVAVASSVAKSVACDGCTAFVNAVTEPDGNIVVYWGGCPSDTCGVGEACQQDSNATYTRAWCKCTNGCTGHCKATVTLNAAEEITGWGCERNGCKHACFVAPFPPVGEGAFYPCTC